MCLDITVHQCVLYQHETVVVFVRPSVDSVLVVAVAEVEEGTRARQDQPLLLLLLLGSSTYIQKICRFFHRTEIQGPEEFVSGGRILEESSQEGRVIGLDIRGIIHQFQRGTKVSLPSS